MAYNGISKVGAKKINQYKDQSTKASKRKKFVGVTQAQSGAPF